MYYLVLSSPLNMNIRKTSCMDLSIGSCRLWVGYFCWRHKFRLFPMRLFVPGGGVR